MLTTKKRTLIIIAVLLLTILLTMTASATGPVPGNKFVHFEGYVPLSSLVFGEGVLEYDMCDPVLVGHIVQPEIPGTLQYGTITVGNVPACPYTTELSGTCEFTILPVEEFGNPDSRKGLAVIDSCTGDFVGLRGKAIIHHLYTYDVWYRVVPSP